MATSFYPQSGVVRRAQSIAPPAAPRSAPPIAGLPRAIGLPPSDALGSGESAAVGNLGLYGCATAELGPRARVLDLGSGDGQGSEWLTRYYPNVVAVDSSVSAAQSTRRNAPGATVHCADFVSATELGISQAAVAIDVLGYVPVPEDVLAALQRALTPDAVVFFAEPRAHVAQCLGPPIRRAFSHRSLTTLLTMSGYEVSRWLDAQTGFVCCLANPLLDGAAQWLSQGYQQLAARALDDALSSFERAEGSPRKPVQLEAAIGEAECFLSQRKRGAAIDAFLRARDLCPEDARPLAGLARIALGRGEINDAIELAKVAYRVDPTDVSAACAHAMVAEKTEPTEARDRWVRAANLAPESFDIALRLAQAAATEQDYALAHWAVQRVQSYGHDHGVPMRVALATALFGMGRLAEALVEARQAQRVSPSDASVLALLSALR